MSSTYLLSHIFRVSFKAKSRFSLDINVPWIVERDNQKVINIKTNPPAKILKKERENWTQVKLRYSLEMPPRGSRTFQIETLLETRSQRFSLRMVKSYTNMLVRPQKQH